MNLKQAVSSACALLLASSVMAGCAISDEAKASRAAATWLHNLQNGQTVSSPSNKTFLSSFENLNLDELDEADQAFEKDYLKNTIRSWQTVEAYQQNGKIIVCMLMNFADPDALTRDALEEKLQENPVSIEIAEASDSGSDETVETEVESSDDAAEVEIDAAADLQSQVEQLSAAYKPEVQNLVLQAAKDAPEIACEVYFQIDPETMDILSIY